MHSASELADWWDGNIKASDKALLDFVDANPNLWVVAAVAQTGMQFAGVMVFDLLRFGEGAAESYETGKIGPLVQDVFRGMAIAGAAWKAAPAAANVLRIGAAKTLGLYANIGGGVCAPIAVGNALRRTGQALFLSLEEIAAAHGLSLARIADEGVSMTSSIAALRKLRIPFDTLKAGSWQNIVARLMESDGVMMIRVVASKSREGHRILLERTGAVVRILDRTGEFADLDSLSARYAGVLNGEKFVVDSAADAVLVKNVRPMKLNGVMTLMMAANAVVQLSPGLTVQDVDRKFQAFNKSRLRVVMHLEPPPRIAVVRGDSLSALALKRYGSDAYWPLIWDENREIIGENPNLIRPGMTLVVPPLSAFNDAEKEAAKRRHSAWRNPH